MTANNLRNSYIKYMVSRGHKKIPSAPLVPENNPSLLFVNAGMVPLVPYLLGEDHPMGKRLTSLQKCLRTEDIDGVGSPERHTFFEMLGHWSLGDYFKKEAIDISYEYLVKHLGINPKNMHVTIFKGDKNSFYDIESEKAWLKVGIPKNRIYPLGASENWWIAGDAGPCGPDSEVWLDTRKDPCGKFCIPGCKCGKFFEIWNNVFMEFNKNSDGSLTLLNRKSVDVGVGVDRTTTILEGLNDNYKASHWSNVILQIEKIAKKSYDDKKYTRSMRIIADHARAAAFCLSEKILPSNVQQGYVVRRIIRRAMREGMRLDMGGGFMVKILEPIIFIYKDYYPQLEENIEDIKRYLLEEEKKFSGCLKKGNAVFEKKSSEYKSKKLVSAKDAFDLYQSYGFPIEMTVEMAKELGANVDIKGFNFMINEHKEKSRKASKGFFKGGLFGNTEIETKYHTATHILHQALREVLGPLVSQKGSNINSQRLRFDFSWDKKLTPDQLSKIESKVNDVINQNLEVSFKTKTLSKAIKEGALAFFKEKYGERVKVYSIGNYSKEVCGGPHVKNTGVLKRFKIVKEESVGAGLRRIKAILD